MRGDPPFLEEIDDFSSFLKHLSGGIERPIYLQRMRNFTRTLKHERNVKGAMWGALARVEIGEKTLPQTSAWRVGRRCKALRLNGPKATNKNY